MSKSGQLRLSLTRNIPVPNQYILGMKGEYAPWTFDEEQAPQLKGRWRSEVFKIDEQAPLDVEIGMGNGLHFAHRAMCFPSRSLVGLELKYKPLIQSIRRALKGGCTNVRAARYNAYLLNQMFEPNEINDLFIFFPDPWEKSRNHKHRLIQDASLETFYGLQRPGSSIYFKTDSRDYFDWALARFQRSKYFVVGHSFDLHNSEFSQNNFVTQFESLFLRQGMPIHFAQLRKT